jgi:hypothetical protein
MSKRTNQAIGTAWSRHTSQPNYRTGFRPVKEDISIACGALGQKGLPGVVSAGG